MGYGHGVAESDTTESLTLLLFLKDVTFSFLANCSWFPYPIPYINVIRPKKYKTYT